MALDGKSQTFQQRGGTFSDRSAIAGRVVGRNLDELGEKARLVRAFAQQVCVDRLHRAIVHCGAGDVWWLIE